MDYNLLEVSTQELPPDNVSEEDRRLGELL